MKDINSNIARFLLYLEAEKNSSKHTLINYKIDLKEFFDCISAKPVGKIDYIDIRKFLPALKERKYSKSSISRKLACVRSFFKFLSRENIVEANRAVSISTPKRERKLPLFLELNEVESLLESAGDLVTHAVDELSGPPAAFLPPVPLLVGIGPAYHLDDDSVLVGLGI